MRLNPFDNDAVDDLRSDGGGLGCVAFYPASHEWLLQRLRGLPSEEEGDAREWGEIVLLTSQRAGFGKTHLLARLGEALAGQVLVVPLEFRREQLLDWEEMFAGLLEFADQPRVMGEGPSLSLLQESARRFFAQAVAEMIDKGEVPCGQRDEALRSLRENWRELFDPAGGEVAVARWFEDVFEALRPSLAEFFSREFRVSYEEAEFWVSRLFQYHHDVGAGLEARSRALGRLYEEGPADWRNTAPEMRARAKFEALAVVLAGGRPVVYVADHLDSFFNDEAGGLDVASILVDMAGMPRCGAVVVSVNADVWESAFNGHLPSAFEDRLGGRRVALTGIDPVEAWEMVADRLNRAGIPDDIAARFNGLLGLGPFFVRQGEEKLPPRQVLRHARECWDHFASMGYTAGDETLPEATEILDMGAAPSLGDGKEDPLELPPVEFLQIDESVEREATPLVEAAAGGAMISGREKAKDAGMFRSPDKAESRDPGDAVERPPHGFRQLLGRIRGRELGMPPRGTFEEELLASRFNRLRTQSMASGINGGLDLGCLRLVLETMGARLPLLDQAVVEFAGHGGTALEWRFDGDAVLFGFDSSTNYPYWQALLEHGLSLRRPIEGGEGDEDFFPPILASAKLVVFCPAQEPLEVVSWMALHEVFEEGADLIDSVELDRETLAGLYAGGQLIEESRAGASSFTLDEIFALLARELDYLWARLTRPLPVEV